MEMSSNSSVMWVIVGIIAVAAACKIAYEAYKKHAGERSARPQNSTPRTVQRPNAVNNTASPRTTTPRTSTHASTDNRDSLGIVNYYANTRHNQKDNWFQFEIKKVNGVWLSYILRMPSLNGRNGDLHKTHRYNADGRYWICYDPQPDNPHDAHLICKGWADRELEYITTGTLFENQNW